MHYVYLLQSISHKSLYIDCTQNIVRRLREHNAGDTFTTRKYAPWVLVYLEGYFFEEDAKFGKVYFQLKRRIHKSILGAEKVRGVDFSP